MISETGHRYGTSPPADHRIGIAVGPAAYGSRPCRMHCKVIRQRSCTAHRYPVNLLYREHLDDPTPLQCDLSGARSKDSGQIMKFLTRLRFTSAIGWSVCRPEQQRRNRKFKVVSECTQHIRPESFSGRARTIPSEHRTANAIKWTRDERQQTVQPDLHTALHIGIFSFQEILCLPGCAVDFRGW